MHPISPIHFYLETTFFSQELESAYATTSFLNFRSTSDTEVITIAYNKTIVIGSARLSYPPPFTNWSTGSLAFVRIGKRAVCAIQWCTPRGASRISYSSHDKRFAHGHTTCIALHGLYSCMTIHHVISERTAEVRRAKICPTYERECLRFDSSSISKINNFNKRLTKFK